MVKTRKAPAHVALALAMTAACAAPAAAYDGGIYFNLARLFYGIMGTGFNIDLLGQAMMNDGLGLSAKAYLQMKAFTARFDLGAGVVWYPLEPLNGPYVSPQMRASFDDKRKPDHYFMLYPELAVGWMFNLGDVGSFAMGIGVEAAADWMWGYDNLLTIVPVLSFWIGGPF